MNEVLGSYTAGDIIGQIRNLMKDYTDLRFPRKAVMNELSIQLLDLQELQGFINDTDYTGNFSVTDTSDTIDLTTLRDTIHYKNYGKIINITYGGSIPCIERSEMDFHSIKAQGALSNWKDSVIWHKRGTVIYFYKGSGVSSYGTRTVWFVRLPAKLANYSDFIDIPDSNMNILRNKVMRALLQAKGLDPNLIIDESERLKKNDLEEKAKNRILN